MNVDLKWERLGILAVIEEADLGLAAARPNPGFLEILARSGIAGSLAGIDPALWNAPAAVATAADQQYF